MSETELQHLRIVVHGRVQAVGYRLFTHGAAIALGVAGTVRNRPDDTVEAIAQADPATIERFLAALRIGPPSGDVTKLELESLDPDPALAGFNILH